MFYREYRVCHEQSESVQSATITQYAKKSCFHGNGVVDTTVLFEGWSTELVYPKCNFNFPNTDAILLKHVFVHVCSVHVIKCKVVFYILLLLYCEKICHANAFRN